MLHLVSPRVQFWVRFSSSSTLMSCPRRSAPQVRLFADDTALYLTMEGKDDSKALKNDLDILSTWETRWDMEFNPSKLSSVTCDGL